LSKKLEKLEKALEKSSKKAKKHRYEDSNSDFKLGVGLGSTRKVETKLEKIIKKTKFTPPSPMKATPTIIASNPDDRSTTSVSNADDVMMTSSSQNEEIHSIHSILLT
jgi:hypothetical protein